MMIQVNRSWSLSAQINLDSITGHGCVSPVDPTSVVVLVRCRASTETPQAPFTWLPHPRARTRVRHQWKRPERQRLIHR